MRCLFSVGGSEERATVAERNGGKMFTDDGGEAEDIALE